MRLPTHQETVFSLKAFTAGMLALYVAFSAGLQNPYWSLTTVYVVMQPLSGAILSKSAFRFVGTLTGAAAGIAIAAMFGTNELACMLAVVAWMCGCMYIALLGRTPKSYFFLLAGITTALVAWPGALASGPVFSVAIARVEEISLGILCAVLVNSVFFPQSVAPLVRDKFRSWLDEAQALSLDVLQPQADDPIRHETTRRMAAEATQIEALSTHLDYESSATRTMAPWVRVLQRRMLLLLPLLSSVEDRLNELRRVHKTLPEPVTTLLDDVRTWLEHKQPRRDVSALRRRIGQLEPHPNQSSDWQELLLAGLLNRLKALIAEWSRCRELEAHLETPRRTPSRRLRALAQRIVAASHVDHGKPLRSILAGLIAGSICAAFWYFTGWPQGGIATLLAFMTCLFLGSLDDPAPMLGRFAMVVAVASVANSLYLYLILPSVHSYALVVAALSVMLVPLGMLAFNPANLLYAVLPVAFMSLRPMTAETFPGFVNSMVGIVCAVMIAMVVTRIVRSMGAELSARRIIKAGRNDLRNMALGTRRPNHSVFLSRMLDRLGLLSPRLGMVGPETDIAAIDMLAEVRLGLNLSALRRAIPRLHGPARYAIRDLMQALAQHLDTHGSRNVAPSSALLHQIDAALAQVTSYAPQHDRTVILTLVGIRRALFPAASPYYMPEGKAIPVLFAEEAG